jgi:asparagine N-glycosylation enzyme membrane subunit Stt3
MKMKNNIWLDIIFWVVFATALFASFWLRIQMPSEDLVFGNRVEFCDVDAYYHMMQADYVYANWPNIETFSKVQGWPDGQPVGQRPLNGWLIGTIAKFSGLAVDVVGVYWPAVIGIVILIPILFIGWVLWNKWAGLIAACAAAVIQGEYYGRLAMGISDQHALEVLLMVCFALFYILAIKKGSWWSIASGVFLGLYYMNWSGGPLLTILLMMFITIQSIINRFNDLPSKKLLFVSFVTLFISSVMFILMKQNEPQYILAYAAACASPFIIQIVLHLTRKMNKIWYPAILIGVVALSISAIFIAMPEVALGAWRSLDGLRGTFGTPIGTLGSTISEMQPLLAPYGSFTLDLVIGCFGLTALFGVAGLIVLATRMKKQPELLFAFMWCFFTIFITIMQRRFGYYSAVNLCLLSGYLFYIMIDRLAWRKTPKKEVKKGKPKVYFSPVVAVVGVIVILVTIIIPNAYWTARETHNHPYLITTAWREALNYLRDKTPDTKDYGVISWWDYGYWIAREGQRPAACHPGGGNTGEVSKFLTAYTTEEANTFADWLKSRYVVIDFYMVYQKFYAIPLIADKGKLTEAQYNDTQVVRMYFSEKGTPGYRLVFESSTKYNGQAQVKIYERYAPLVEPCNCGK